MNFPLSLFILYPTSIILYNFELHKAKNIFIFFISWHICFNLRLSYISKAVPVPDKIINLTWAQWENWPFWFLNVSILMVSYVWQPIIYSTKQNHTPDCAWTRIYCGLCCIFFSLFFYGIKDVGIWSHLGFCFFYQVADELVAKHRRVYFLFLYPNYAQCSLMHFIFALNLHFCLYTAVSGQLRTADIKDIVSLSNTRIKTKAANYLKNPIESSNNAVIVCPSFMRSMEILSDRNDKSNHP